MTVGGEDYDGSPVTVDVPAGVMMHSFTIDIINTNTVECIERFIVRIISVTTCGVTVGSDNTSEVIITDDDSKLVIIKELMQGVCPLGYSLIMSV